MPWAILAVPSFRNSRVGVTSSGPWRGRPAKVSHVREWMMWSVVRLARIFNRHLGELMAFFTTMASVDVVAPPTGTHTLEAHYRKLASDA